MYLFSPSLRTPATWRAPRLVMDRLMQALGLPGKSFVPLIVGLAATCRRGDGRPHPSTRRASVLMTIMMAPFMSCGARLAIFAVFAAAFFGQNGALAVFSLYCWAL